MKKAFLSGMIVMTFFFTFMFATISNSQTEETSAVKSLENVTQEQIETVRKLIDMIVEFCVK